MPTQPATNIPLDQSIQNGKPTLADILLAQGVLDEQKAKQIKLLEIQSGKSQEDIIKERKVVDESS